MGNGTGPQVGDPDAEEEAAPQTDLKKTSPNQRYVLGLLTCDVAPQQHWDPDAQSPQQQPEFLFIGVVLSLFGHAPIKAAESS